MEVSRPNLFLVLASVWTTSTVALAQETEAPSASPNPPISSAPVEAAPPTAQHPQAAEPTPAPPGAPPTAQHPQATEPPSTPAPPGVPPTAQHPQAAEPPPTPAPLGAPPTEQQPQATEPPSTPDPLGADAYVDAPYPFPVDEPRQWRSHPLDARSAFEPGKGLVFTSRNGDFALETRLRAQFLYTVEAEEGEDGELGPATQGAELRRARLQFKGHFWGRDNQFKVELAVSPKDVGVRDSANSTTPATSILLDWYLDLTHYRDASLRVGQYKVPFNRQRVISSGDLQLVDRSIVNANFNVDRDIGLDLRSKNFLGLDLLKYYLGVFTGEGRNTAHQSDFGMMYLGRVELLPMGPFKDYLEVDFERWATPKLSVGLGYGHLDRTRFDRGILGSPPADGGTTDFHLFNADALLKYAGWSVFSEAVLRRGSRNPGNAEDETGQPIGVAPALEGYGAMLQTGYLLPRTRFEIAGRVGLVRPVGESTLAPQDEVGGGVSYYFARHAYKLQADYFLLTRGDQPTRETHQVRVQLQAAF